MPLVKIQGVRLSADLKKRIGDHIIDAFHREGIPGSSVIVVYSREDVDILLDGGYLIESTVDPSPQAPRPALEAPAQASAEVLDEFKTRSRRTKAELADLKAQLVNSLQNNPALSSFQAQEELGLILFGVQLEHLLIGRDGLGHFLAVGLDAGQKHPGVHQLGA